MAQIGAGAVTKGTVAIPLPLLSVAATHRQSFRIPSNRWYTNQGNPQRNTELEQQAGQKCFH